MKEKSRAFGPGEQAGLMRPFQADHVELYGFSKVSLSPKNVCISILK